MFTKKVMVVVVVVVIGAVRAASAHPAISTQKRNQQPANYEYQYGVVDGTSGNEFGQRESRDHLNTSGSYHVRLPDGRVLRVTYKVTPETGYVAKVTYEGEATYPEIE